MKIFINGISGFLGKNLAFGLSTVSNSKIIGLDVNELDFGIDVERNNIDFIKGSFINLIDLKKIDTADVFVHVARTIPPGLANNEYKRDIKENLMGTINLFEHAVKCGSKKFIFISSGGTVYGSDPEPRSYSEAVDKTSHVESEMCFPVGMYGLSMYTIERYLKFIADKSSVKLIILRLSNPFGPFQHLNRGQGFVNVLLENHIFNRPTEIWGSGLAVRDYIYSGDVVDAINKSIIYKGRKTIFNIGSGKGISINKVVSDVENLIGEELNIIRKPEKEIKVSKNILNVDLAKSEMNWQCSTDWINGIEKTYVYYKSKYLKSQIVS